MSSFTSTSSCNSTSSSSPSTSPSQPISFSSSASSNRSSFSSTTSTSSSWNAYSTCACPAGSSFYSASRGTPSAYVSDEDLFGDDDAYLSEPPPPPRPAEAYLARPLLPPVVQFKPRQCSTPSKKKRRSSSIKTKE